MTTLFYYGLRIGGEQHGELFTIGFKPGSGTPKGYFYRGHGKAKKPVIIDSVLESHESTLLAILSIDLESLGLYKEDAP